MLPTNFDKAFLVTTIAMRLNRSHPSIERNFFWVFQFIIILTLSATSFVFLTNSVLFYDIPSGRFAEASKNGTMSIIALTITTKYAFLLYFQTYLKSIIDIVNADYEESKDFDVDEIDLMVRYCKRGANVSIYWFVSATATGIIFPVKAISKMIYSYIDGELKFVPMFDMRYPTRVDIVKETPSIFMVLFALCLMFGVYTITMYLGFDPLVPIFLLHICGQLDVLSKRIMEIHTRDSDPQEVTEKLKHINIKLQKLYNMTSLIKSKFAMIFEYNMKTTTFLLPLALFQVVEDLREHKLNLEFMSFFVAHILHFYMPCYYSDTLMDRSQHLREIIYSCGWEKHLDIRSRKTILIMLTKTTAPLVLSTVFYPICLDTFAEMCRHAYAIFNIMNAALA